MSFIPTPTESNILTATRSFLLAILPTGTEVIIGQGNRVPEPTAPNFVVMTTIFRERLETNIDTYSDCKITGSIAAAIGTTPSILTVTNISFGVIVVGNQLFGNNVAAATFITAQLTGAPGGTGTYSLSVSQSIVSQTLSCGQENISQHTQITVQLDVHAPTIPAGSDMAQTISTLLRDDYSIEPLGPISNYGSAGFDVTPLYAGEPKQIPFINENKQFESRWVVEAVLQANQVVTPPQQFADQATVTFIPADIFYPL